MARSKSRTAKQHDKARLGGAAPGVPTDGEASTALLIAVPDASHPREGSKGALLVSLLSLPEGASIDDLMARTGWLPHTTRAALTGLRKRGFEIARDAAEKGGSRYRIAKAEPEPAPAARRRRKARNDEAHVSA
ncbi:DUF3489 domain-containing protein [uncultured Enterovirga sp.]|uniref:DUF3489 domain-containing protein n=1 Tax=uncultured Enterovirga sp. TaxID=2026352 RepID=UPI0035C94B37